MPQLISDPSSSRPRRSANDSLVLARKALMAAISGDYLSSGRGHQLSRRVIADRLHADTAIAAVAQPTRAAQMLARRSRSLRNGVCADSEQHYMGQVGAVARLSSCEEFALVRKMRAGDQAAHDALIEAHLGLVVMFARRYRRVGVPLMDIVAEGNIGLLTAARKFDPERGFRFATYAKWWVQQAIQVALPRLVLTVRVPVSRGASDPGRSVPHAPAAELGSDHGEGNSPPPYPSGHPMLFHPDEGAAPAPCTSDESGPHPVGPFASFASRSDHSPTAWAPTSSARTASCPGLDCSDEEALARLTIDPDEEPPAALMASERARAIHRALACLSERDRIIVAERFALMDGQGSTLEALSQRFRVSIERIRQIECNAVRKLAVAMDAAGDSAATLL